MSLLDKLKKNSKIKETSILEESTFFKDKDMVSTDIPAINLALSGDLNGGLQPGLTVVAGPSKHFKSSICLVMASAYLKHYPEAVLLFYDSEFGSPQEYFRAYDIDPNRVLHTPITDVEQLKFDIMAQLTELKRGERVFILVDSIGNLASKKEVEDAMNEKAVADMSRAKQLKSLFRMVTPHLTMKDIPMVCINHTYKTMELYAKDIISGGCLVAGTKIKTTRGDIAIEDVHVGDMVETRFGMSRVSHTWNPETLVEGTPECFEITFEDGTTVTCSDGHKFLVGGEWVEATKLIEGDEVQTINNR